MKTLTADSLTEALEDLRGNALAVGREAGPLAQAIAVDRIGAGERVVVISAEPGSTDWGPLSPWLLSLATNEDQALRAYARVFEIIEHRRAVMSRESVSSWGALPRSVRDEYDIDDLTVIIEHVDRLNEFKTVTDIRSTTALSQSEVLALNTSKFLVTRRLAELTMIGAAYGISQVLVTDGESPFAASGIAAFPKRMLIDCDNVQSQAQGLFNLSPDDAQIFVEHAAEGFALLTDTEETVDELPFIAETPKQLAARLEASGAPRLRRWRINGAPISEPCIEGRPSS